MSREKNKRRVLLFQKIKIYEIICLELNLFLFDSNKDYEYTFIKYLYELIKKELK